MGMVVHWSKVRVVPVKRGVKDAVAPPDQVHITYNMTIPRGRREAAERALALHDSHCPVWGP